jgi:dTDP-4-dehydrorhamnose reductase
VTLILGGAGLLGRALVAEARARRRRVVALARGDVDVTRREEVLRAARDVAPETIVNCAAMTAVDACEARRTEAMAVNGQGVAHVAAAAREVGAGLVQISTDFVFAGRRRTPYPEGHRPAPLSVYGASKLEGERQASRLARSLVVRTSWLFGPGGPNFVATIARRLAEGGGPLRVVDDQVGCPTYTPFLARAIWDLIGLRSTGIVHYRNGGPISWHGFAVRIASLLGETDDVVAISSEELARPARRPRFSVLDVSRFERLTGRTVESWEAGLEHYLRQIRDRKTP